MIPETSDLGQGGEKTALLTIHLREGFEGDTVQIQVAGETVLDREDVHTDFSVGLAAVVETEVPLGPIVVELTVLTQEISDRTTLDIKGRLYLAVSIISGHVQYQTSDETFLYF